MSDLSSLLRMWRAKKAAQEGVEPFRVLTNAALDGIAARHPKTPDELMEVKGIKDAKCRQYGRDILDIVAHSGGGTLPDFVTAKRTTHLPLSGGGQGGGDEKLTFRRKLRNNPTPQEVILWARLRDKQVGCKFRRQHPIGEYVVDFCCIEKRIVIEVDGSQHIRNRFADEKRSEFLRSQGYSVLRFWNNEVNENIDGVMLKVEEAIGGILPSDSPPSEGGEDKDRLLLGEQGGGVEQQKTVDDTLSVSRFLDGVNLELSGMAARVRGEVSSVDERERAVYFSIKDPKDGSLLSCLIFRFQYDASGIRLREGDEIIVEGVPEIWKPMGKFSLKAGVIEYAGEGALKKAYDKLYRKLESEGVFAPERKRLLPEFPERIALITSEQGAAIGDFLTNVGSLGIRIDFYPSSVEGKRAVLELLRAIRTVRKRGDSYDLLVIVRGGGSIESLQAFNTESLVREIDACEIPVIAGIGHEKDISLAALAADRMVSTPTAAARTIREPFERARQTLDHYERIILSSYGDALRMTSDRLEGGVTIFLEFLDGISVRFEHAVSALRSAFGVLSYRIRSDGERIDRLSAGVAGGFRSATKTTRDRIDRLESALRTYDPNRVLSLGYGLIRAANGTLLRKSTDTRVGDRLDIRLSEGRIGAEVKEVE